MLDPLLQPRSVAVIGASAVPGKVGQAIMKNLAEQFAGTILPINPKTPEIFGRPCFADIREAPGPIDLAVIALPTGAVKQAVEGCIAARVGSIIVITAGFKETGREGAALEADLASLCRHAGIRLMGPNCLGLINTQHRLNASFASLTPPTGGISIISQSGALCTAILDWSAGRGIGLAKLVSLGNKADLDEVDFLKALAEDPDSRVIVGYLESISNGEEFIKVAENVAMHKPVAILKVGTSVAGSRAASSHTGSLAGADIAYGAAFKRAGVIRAEAFEELMDIGLAFSMQPLPRGKRVAIITNAGGPGIMAADAVENSGLEVVRISSETAAFLKERLPPAASVGNPIDVLGDADAARYAMALEAALADEAVDAVIVLLTPQAMTDARATAEAIASVSPKAKPVLVSFMGGKDVTVGRELLVARGVPDYSAPERAVRALKAMVDYSAWRHRPPRIVTRFSVNRRRVERVLSRAQKSGILQLGEVEAKAILDAYDFSIAPGQLCSTAEEAVEVAVRSGFPVAMKIVSPDIVHKSDIGGVRLNLTSPEEVLDAFDLMMLRITRRAPKARILGVYTERMAPRGTEVILGMTRDPQFGPMLMFGLGGIFVEVMKDVTFHLAPITAEEALQMLVGTRSYKLLTGARGRSGVDLQAIANCLQRISQLVTDFPQIAEMDINPLIVGDLGAEPVVADARMRLSFRGARHE
jgi:acetyltransferase